MTRFASLIGGLIALAIETPAWSKDAKIDRPTMHEASVDWCATYQKNCGADGANLYCQKIGFAEASNWKTFKTKKTWVIGSDQYCTGDDCVGFSEVTCVTGAGPAPGSPAGPAPGSPAGPAPDSPAGPAPGSPAGPGSGSSAGVGIVIGGSIGADGIDNPTINGAIVDHCSTWATNCGEGGANLYCQLNGFSGATNWTTFQPGTTWVIGSNEFCNGGFCTGFSHVTCAN